LLSKRERDRELSTTLKNERKSEIFITMDV
jgi:hypothetical protein